MPSPQQRLPAATTAWAMRPDAAITAGIEKRRGAGLLLLVYLAVTLLYRAPTFDNPVLHVDEQFYLYMGDRLLHGHWPYLDVWDRKPLGLFVLFAAMRSLGGDGVLAYQLVATLCVAATATVIHLIARHHASERGALVAALSYPLFLAVFNCFGGQAQVYYNLLVAAAGLLLVREVSGIGSGRLLARGCGAMLLIGCAVQIKHNPVFEGFAFGLILLHRGRLAGWPAPRLIAAGAAWAGVAAIPTVAALLLYVSMGHAWEFIYANFLSVFGRDEDLGKSLWRLSRELFFLLPFWLCIRRTPIFTIAGAQGAARRFLALWCAVAFAAFLLFGIWYDHYPAPLLVPFAAMAAPALGRSRVVAAYLLLSGAIIGVYAMMHNIEQRGGRQEVTQMTAAINAARHGGCMFMFDAEPILYHTTKACLVTPYAFPNHISSLVERRIADQPAELLRAFARRPAVVLMPDRPRIPRPNTLAWRLAWHELAVNYHIFARVQMGRRGRYYVFQRADLGLPSKRSAEAM